MTHVQRLKYSLLIILVVLGLMLGLSHLQKQGTISEQTFQMPVSYTHLTLPTTPYV